LIVQTARGDSLWVKGISEPRVRDTRVRLGDTVVRFVITVVSYRVTPSIWWDMFTINHDQWVKQPYYRPAKGKLINYLIHSLIN